MASARPSSWTLTAPGPLRLYSMSELIRLPPPGWLVQDTLPSGGLIGLYGPSGQYKSFVAMDMAMSVATGTPWHGKAVQQDSVLYVAAEGGTGIGIRAHAWAQERHVSPAHADIMFLIESLPVSADNDNMNALFGRLNNEVQTQPGLIIIDTLARCFDGNENEQEDMGLFVGGVDRLRREFNATVIVVHHTRLDADRERGSTAFRGASDAMIRVKKTRDYEFEVSCDKQKDAEEFSARQFEMRKVLLPPHPVTGQVLDSIVPVEPATERDEQIRQWLADTEGLRFGELLSKAQTGSSPISPAALKRRLVSLVKNGEIIKENGIYMPARAHLETE